MFKQNIKPVHEKSSCESHNCRSSHHFSILQEPMEAQNYCSRLKAKQISAEFHTYQLAELHCSIIQYSYFVLVPLEPWQNDVDELGEKLQASQLLALLLLPLVVHTFCTFLLMHNCCQCNLLIHCHTHPTHNASRKRKMQPSIRTPTGIPAQGRQKITNSLNLIDCKFLTSTRKTRY